MFTLKYFENQNSPGNIGARYHLSLDFCHYTFLESSRHLVYGMKGSLGSSGDNKSPETIVWRVPVAPYSKKWGKSVSNGKKLKFVKQAIDNPKML